MVAEQAGCDGIVCHLREDRRHIQEQDLVSLKRVIQVPLNLEMSCDPQIVRIAVRSKPEQATLVPERRQELTTEGGLDLGRPSQRLKSAVRRLGNAGIRVSLFIDPDPTQVQRACELGVPMVELHTGRYAQAGSRLKRQRALEQLEEAAELATASSVRVAAGHGLDYHNVGEVAAIPEVEELNIGFSIIARAVEVGFHQAVQEMVALVHRMS
jgi:pyridoxine 5-phosphate synthase